MNISFDSSFIMDFLSIPAEQMLLKVFFLGGWIPIAVVFLWGIKEVWLDYIAGQWYSQQSFKLLAIDIPRGNDASLKSVENMFTYFAGAHGSLNLIDTHWIGKFQLSFSFEIVSIDGYTQFLIRTPKEFVNMVESGIYSVYPDAEISEVNDYVDAVPDRFPDDEWDMWGAEFIQVAPDCYPIKTYPQFEDSTSAAGETFKDPMATLMDLNSSLRTGEQLWYQILVSPTDFSWRSRCDDEISKILKEKVSKKSNILDGAIDVFLKVLSEIGSIFSLAWSGESSEKAPETDDSLKMMNLKPKEKKQVEAIQEKASKLGFNCKIRMIYVAKKDVINKPKGINGFVGYIKQFIDLDLNNFKPDMDKTATSVSYFFKKSRLRGRQNRLMGGYKNRSGVTGRLSKLFNIEELATLWHFPIEAVVKAPLIQKAPGRKSEPPTSLPFEDEGAVQSDVFANSGIFEDEVLADNSASTKKTSIFEDEVVNEDKDNKNSSSLPEFFDDENLSEKDSVKKDYAPGNLPFA